MRIVQCTEGARADAGGLGLVAVPQIARTLAARGHAVVVETFGPLIPGSESFATSDARRAFITSPVAITYPAAGRYTFSWAGQARVFEHVAHADFVMLHSLYSFAVLSGYLAARRYGKPYGLWPHGVLAPFQRRVGARKKAIYDRFLARRILDQAAVLFYSAPGECEEAAPLRLRAPSAIIPHGIDVEPFLHLPPRGIFRARYLDGFDGVLLLYLGRLNAKKGLDLLVESMSAVHLVDPTVRLAIVGAGDPPEFRAQVEVWVKRAGLQNRVVLPGLMLGHAKLEALADADIFVLPSQAENFSFAMFEALASCLPVVVSDTLNLAGQVAEVGAGRAVPRATQAFASALLELSADPALRRRMGEAGRRLAATYSWDSVGRQLEGAMEAVMRHEPLPRDPVGQAAG